MKVAVVHDWIAARAGSEKVFEALANLFPEADLWCLTRDVEVPLCIGDRAIRTTWLDRAALRGRRGVTLPLMPIAWASVRGGQYDLVLSSSLAFAHSVRFGRRCIHLSYVHSPARYLWSPELDLRGQGPWLRPAKAGLRAYDRRVAQYPTALAANSAEVARRIKRCWNREARVIPPPVDLSFFTIDSSRPSRDYVLGFSRWIRYKRLDLVLRTAKEAGLPCVIAGSGPEGPRLKRLAADLNVDARFVERPDDFMVRELLRNAAALVFPVHEDFGIVPVEAMACGTPVVALGRGGVVDTVTPGCNGELLADFDPAKAAASIESLRRLDRDAIRRSVSEFSYPAFCERVKAWVGDWTIGE